MCCRGGRGKRCGGRARVSRAACGAERVCSPDHRPREHAGPTGRCRRARRRTSGSAACGLRRARARCNVREESRWRRCWVSRLSSCGFLGNEGSCPLPGSAASRAHRSRAATGVGRVRHLVRRSRAACARAARGVSVEPCAPPATRLAALGGEGVGAGRARPGCRARRLNTVPWSAALHDLERDAYLASSSDGFGLQASWPSLAGFAGLPIDQLLTSRDLTPTRRQTRGGFGSSHHSLWVELATTHRIA